MQNLSDRIQLIIDAECNGKATRFANRLGINSANVSKWRSGLTAPSRQTIQQIADTFGYNADWLETGEGIMRPPQSRDDEIADIVRAAAQHDPEKAAKFFTDLFGSMTDGEIVLMYELFRKHFSE